MTEAELLNSGIAAGKAGDRVKAASIFAQVVKINPASEAGWYYLAMCVPSEEQRQYCLRRVLEINPRNAQAREKLSKPTAAPFVSEETPVESQPAVQPFSGARTPRVDEGPARPFVEPELPRVPQRSAASPRPNRTLTTVLLGLAALFIPLIIAVVAVVALFPRAAQQAFVPTSAGGPAANAGTSAVSSSVSATSTAIPTAVPSALPTKSYTAKYEQATCPFTEPRGADVSCGTLIVPEDRTGDITHTIKLSVAVYHGANKNPDVSPVIFLQGGPGAGAVQLAADAFPYLVEPFLGDRDFIVFDQRGTGYSEANLQCDELKKLYLQDIHGLIPASTRKLVYSNAFLSCSGLMSVSGVNLNAYTTVASAADINDLVAALGYKKVDLYGASYGTRLALVVMRDYPNILHSVILDSVVPVDTNFFKNYPVSIQSGLQALFDSCAAQAKCAAAYPDLKTVFWDTINKLDANPVTLTTSHYPTGTITESVSGSTAMSIILGSIKSTTFIDTAPETIYRFRDGDYSTLIAAQDSLPFAFEDVSPGLYISMMCHEHILATSPAELESISNQPGVKDFAWLPFYGDANDLFRTCKSWGAHGPLLGENNAVFSDIPTLIITGKFDPTTPPMFAQQVAAQLSHSYYFEFPNQGHTPTAADTSGCAMTVAVAFLKSPAVEPKRDCLDQLDPVKFIVPYNGDPPLKLITVDVAGVSVDAPADWHTLGDGYFFRFNSPLDITQVGVQRVDVPAEDLKKWMSLSAYGYRGLDSAPFKVGQRDVRGRTWSLYLSTANGRPVDIAMLDQGSTSLMVIMFSNLDEHDALYKTIFLPMIDSAR